MQTGPSFSPAEGGVHPWAVQGDEEDQQNEDDEDDETDAWYRSGCAGGFWIPWVAGYLVQRGIDSPVVLYAYASHIAYRVSCPQLRPPDAAALSRDSVPVSIVIHEEESKRAPPDF